MKTDLKAVIDNELAALRDNRDEEFTPPVIGTDIPKFIESKAKIDEEALALDELIASIPKAQGYYLKLYKEVGTGNYEYKYRENNWETWTDFEDEISKIVKSFTQKNPLRWGSGHYRIIIWRDGGIREKRKPIDLYIDADEPTMIPGMSFTPQPPNASENISSLSALLDVVSKINPTVSPTDQLKANSEAFMKGMELAKSKESSNDSALATAMQSMSTMMVGFMTLMMNQNNANKPVDNTNEKINPIEMMKANVEMMKNMGIFDKPAEPKTKTLAEQITEIRTLGLIKDESPKSLVDTVKELKELGLWQGSGNTESPIAKINEVKEMVSLAGELAGLGKGESPSALDRVIDILVPKVPDMVTNITGAVSKYSDAVKNKGTVISPSNTSNSSPNTQTTVSEDNDTMLFGFHPLFKELYKAIDNADNTKFGYITQQVSSLLGEQLIKDIVTGNMNAEMLSAMIQQYGGYRFKDVMFITGKMNPYLNEYVMWIRATYDVKPLTNPLATPGAQPTPVNQPKPIANTNKNFITYCNKCGDEVEWSSKENFEIDTNHMCGLQTEPNTFCDGTLIPTKEITKYAKIRV